MLRVGPRRGPPRRGPGPLHVDRGRRRSRRTRRGAAVAALVDVGRRDGRQRARRGHRQRGRVHPAVTRTAPVCSAWTCSASALERARSRRGRGRGAWSTLLERHGQGGACSRDHPGFTYHNSFLVADRCRRDRARDRGPQLGHRAGRAEPGRSISNGLTIPGFAQAHADRLRSGSRQPRLRRPRTQPPRPAARPPGRPVRRAARPRRREPTRGTRCVNGALAHRASTPAGSSPTARPRRRGSPTWATRPRHWATATAAPCTSMFKPVAGRRPSAPGSGADRPGSSPRAAGGATSRCTAWPPVTSERPRPGSPTSATPIERSWVERAAARASGPTSSPTQLEERWAADVAAADLPDRRPAAARAYWRRQDRAAGWSPPQRSTRAAAR